MAVSRPGDLRHRLRGGRSQMSARSPRAFLRVALTLSILWALGAPAPWAGSPEASAGVQAAPPSIVLILTDDQRWDSLWAMPAVQNRLISRGVAFTNGYVVNPLCCPSRTSILTGQYSHS